jgi:creatinine deaminase
LSLLDKNLFSYVKIFNTRVYLFIKGHRINSALEKKKNDSTKKISGGGFIMNSFVGQSVDDIGTQEAQDCLFYAEALKEAEKGLAEGGIPIGAALVCDGKLIGRGHNKRVQEGSVIKHGETDCMENAGRQTAETYSRCTLYTTLSPCDMCTGTILLYKIPRVVIGENKNFMGNEALLKQRGIEVVVRNDEKTITMMATFIEQNPYLWNEDIGEKNAEE